MSFEQSTTTRALPLGDGGVDSDIAQENVEKNNGLFLRWSRVKKSVMVQGTYDSRFSFGKPTIATGQINGAQKGNSKKTILSKVSGYAAPGEVMAMMGCVNLFSDEYSVGMFLGNLFSLSLQSNFFSSVIAKLFNYAVHLDLERQVC